MDRRQAMARGKDLPDRARGAALFADISGFTPLTEALVREFGPQRGAEELTHHLNLVYDALIAELHRYGGSVIGFSGDAITCWLDGDTGLRATACALTMQQRMDRFASVPISSDKTVSPAMKAAVATGTARRFVVELWREGLQVNSDGAHVPQQHRQGFFVHPSIGVEQGSHARLFGHFSDIEHVLVKDRGLVVGERYGIAPYLLGQFDGLLEGYDDVLYFLEASL
jgi:hypothetical protein